jgi:type II secretory pathway pseudopilin PulG
MLSALAGRLRHQPGDAGMSVVELLFAVLLTAVVVSSSVDLLTRATHSNDQTQRRTVAVNQGRTAIDQVIRRLRSEVCVPTSGAPATPVVSGTGTSMTFYMDFGDGTGTPERHTLALAANGTLTDTVVQGVGSPPAYTGTGTAYTLATGIVQSGATPFLQYYAFTAPATGSPTPTAPLPTPLSAADAAKVARIVVTLQADPPGRQDGTRTATLTDEAFIRLADPNNPAPVPTCT